MDEDNDKNKHKITLCCLNYYTLLNIFKFIGNILIISKTENRRLIISSELSWFVENYIGNWTISKYGRT